jgi:molybdopterin-guanine dinucleotide biosynthesis protein B
VNSIKLDLPILGFAAFSGTGKTTLITHLLPLLNAKGIKAGLVKHSHHDFDIDQPGKDSYRLRKAGASPVMLISKYRRTIITEKEVIAEPLLANELTYLDKSEIDLVIVEGFKHESLPKIELHRPSLGKPLLFPEDPDIIAIACDEPIKEQPTSPVLDLNNPEQISQFIIDHFSLTL